MRHKRISWLPFLAVILLGMSACNEDDLTNPGDNGGKAALSVYLTDAPGDVEAVWVVIQGITLQGNGSGPVQLLDAPTDLIPLTDLVGTTQLLVTDAELDPAAYSQVRLLVGDAVLESTDGTVYVKGDPVLPEGLEGAPLGELQCPSCSQSGLKVKIPNDAVELGEGASALVLDFDVAQSFGHKAGNSGKWIMHPVIHGMLVEDSGGDGETGDDIDAVNGIRGTVALAEGVTIPECPEGQARSVQDFIPMATATTLVDGEGMAIERTGVVASDGTFEIGVLAPDTYTLGYEGTLDLETVQLVFTATVDPAQAVISNVEGEDVEGVAYVIQSATCNTGG